MMPVQQLPSQPSTQVLETIAPYLDRQARPVAHLGFVDLGKAGRGQGLGREARKKLRRRRPQVLGDGLLHVRPGAHRAAIEHVSAHGLHILCRDEVIQHAQVLAKLDCRGKGVGTQRVVVAHQ